jgi:hypothetical protein
LDGREVEVDSVSKASKVADGSVGSVVEFLALAASASQDAEVVGAFDISPREQDRKRTSENL